MRFHTDHPEQFFAKLARIRHTVGRDDRETTNIIRLRMKRFLREQQEQERLHEELR